MPIKNFELHGDKDLWCVFIEESIDPSEDVNYFLTERSAKNWCKKNKINLEDVIIFQENN